MAGEWPSRRIPGTCASSLGGIGQLERCRDQLAQRREVERFRDEVERTQLQRPHGRFHVAVRRDDGDRQLRPVRLHPFDEAQAVAVRAASCR